MEKNRPSKNTPNLGAETSLPPPKTLTARHQDRAGHSEEIKIRNISRGGICIENHVPLPVGSTLRLLLHFHAKTVEAQGEVIWNSQEGSIFLHGITFTFMTQEARQWFNTFVMDWAAEQIAEQLDFSELETLPAKAAPDRRSFARLKIPLHVDIGFNRETAILQTKVFDLSEGGLCVMSELDLQKGQEVFLQLWFDNATSVSLASNVRYSAKKTIANKVVYFHGVEFSKNDAEALEQIAKFLNGQRACLDAIEITLDDIIGRATLPELP